MEYQAALHAPSHFFPVLLVKASPGQPSEIVEHLGTGFFLFPGVLITCWHCVADQPPPGCEYAIRVEESKGRFKAYFLEDIERDANGTDIATARCQYTPPQELELWTSDLLLGEELWAFGYPYPERQRKQDGTIHHVISGRLLRGYMTRHFLYDHPTLGRTDAYELDMRAPQGISGAALIRRDTCQVAGLIFGSADVETIEEFASVDTETGEREPEVRRIVSFALAYDTESLGKLRTSATNKLPLAEYIRTIKGT
ncbi:serine protease [Cupriavidus sp. 2MCAB6]|uniref:S1 family peptidase n=1 Tax=Cupriavidus sp. 2MCAB6 TaxID=3232981 RepID=UPI003F91A8EA